MIKKIDHIVITTNKIEECIAFYEKLGFTIQNNNGRYKFFGGDFSINVHILGKEFLPHAKNIQIGSTDLCFELSNDIDEYMQFISKQGIDVELEIVPRYGTRGNMKSFYIRDPDENLIEFCSYEK